MEPEFLSCSNLLKNFNDANPPNDKIFNLGGVCGVKVLTGIFGFTFFGIKPTDWMKPWGRPCLTYRNIKRCYFTLLKQSQYNLTELRGPYGPLGTRKN